MATLPPVTVQPCRCPSCHRWAAGCRATVSCCPHCHCGCAATCRGATVSPLVVPQCDAAVSPLRLMPCRVAVAPCAVSRCGPVCAARRAAVCRGMTRCHLLYPLSCCRHVVAWCPAAQRGAVHGGLTCCVVLWHGAWRVVCSDSTCHIMTWARCPAARYVACAAALLHARPSQ